MIERKTKALAFQKHKPKIWDDHSTLLTAVRLKLKLGSQSTILQGEKIIKIFVYVYLYMHISKY